MCRWRDSSYLDKSISVSHLKQNFLILANWFDVSYMILRERTLSMSEREGQNVLQIFQK